MTPSPKFAAKFIDIIGDQQIRFKTSLSERITYSFFAAVFCAGLLFAIWLPAPADAVGVKIILGVVAAIPLPFFCYFALPRSLRLDFDAGTYVITIGTTPLGFSRSGRIDEISSVYVARAVAGNNGVVTYCMGLTFGHPPIKWPVLSIQLPRCNVIQCTEKEKAQLWEYAKSFAAQLSVPCEPFFWEPTN